MGVLEDFDKTFNKDHKLAAVTWHRDVDAEFVDGPNADLLTWAMVVPAEPTEQRLAALALKWHMDVDEMFYVGEEHMGEGVLPAKGLLNGGFGDRAGTSVLVDPSNFAKLAIAKKLSGELPCKWLQMVGADRFTYDRAKLLFKLRWPRLAKIDGSMLAYVGGVAPLAHRT
jgi:hypothetical protein